MILVGNARGGAKDLALHLQKDENDHVTVHELRGFTSDNLNGALNEAYAVSRGTKCQKFLFSLSLNPPHDAEVSTEAFEKAINRIESQLELEGQPRAIVFHEKEGRRHAHAVWSRIDHESMTARPLPYHKNKLQDVARELYHEHGWRMPDGFADRSKSDPRSFTLEQWQQAKRHDRDPQEIKDAFRDSWAISDSKAAFEHALKERGYWMARGDRRGFVAIDRNSEIYSIPRQAGIKTKMVRERLGDEADLPSLEEAQAKMARDMQAVLSRLYNEQASEAKLLKERYAREKQQLVKRQRSERKLFLEKQQQRQLREQQNRQSRFRTGLKGLWDRMRGEHRRLSEQNMLEACASQQRAKAELGKMIFAQLLQRRLIKERAQHNHGQVKQQALKLRREREHFNNMSDDKQQFFEKRRKPKRKQRSRDGPSFEP